jgi:hypothetical protein
MPLLRAGNRRCVSEVQNDRDIHRQVGTVGKVAKTLLPRDQNLGYSGILPWSNPAGSRLPSEEPMTMTTERSDCVERRCGQRFCLHVTVSLRLLGSQHESGGFTQDLSARGAYLFTDSPLAVGEKIEVTLLMPAQITLGESMRVRCRATVLRVIQPATGTRLGVAVHFAGYEYLPEHPEDSVSQEFSRISALHEHSEEPPARSANHSRSMS